MYLGYMAYILWDFETYIFWELQLYGVCMLGGCPKSYVAILDMLCVVCVYYCIINIVVQSVDFGVY